MKTRTFFAHKEGVLVASLQFKTFPNAIEVVLTTKGCKYECLFVGCNFDEAYIGFIKTFVGDSRMIHLFTNCCNHFRLKLLLKHLEKTNVLA